MARLQELTLKGNNRALLLLALIAGLVAAVLVFVAVNSSDNDKTATVSDAVDTVPVVVAAQSIGAGDDITADMVKVVQFPAGLAVVGAVDDSELVVGDVARVAIAEGEQFTRGKLGVPVPDKGLSGVIPPGMRAVSFSVQEVTAVGGLLIAGDRVDVVASYRIKKAPGLAEDEYILRTETILQDIEVLSVAQEAQEAAARTSGEEGTEEAASGVPSYTSGELPDDVEEQPRAVSVTVALTPAQVLALVSMQEHAERIYVDERAFGDTVVSEIPFYDVVLVEN